MTHLTVYRDHDPSFPELATRDPVVLIAHLAMTGILFEQWAVSHPLPHDAVSDDVLAAYAMDVARLQAARGYKTVDVARVPRGVANAAELRAKFLDEHTHSEDEARFFVEGGGAFYLHIDRRVFRIVCETGDLLSVPAGVKHWFDMGPDPHFTAIRFFKRPDGWVAEPTGADIAARFPSYEGPTTSLR